MASQKLSVYTLKLNNELNWDTVIHNLLSLKTIDSYCIINEQSAFYIGGCYLFEAVHNELQYNLNDKKFETVTSKKLNILKFDIFLSSNTMMLWGSKKVSSLFLTSLEQASEYKLTIDCKKTDFKFILKRLLNVDGLTFNRMKIVDVVIEHGIVVNCSVNLKIQENAVDLIEKYFDTISQISVVIDADGQTVSLTLHSSGALTIFKDRDEIADETIRIVNYITGGIN